MPEIKRYTILVELDSSSLEKAVMEHLKKGWIPLGGVSTCVNNSSRMIYQAMISYSITDHS